MDNKTMKKNDKKKRATPVKFSHVRFLLNNKVLTLFGNTANSFSCVRQAKTAFSAVRSWLVEPKIGGHLGAAKTSL